MARTGRMPMIFGLDFGTSNSALSLNVDGQVTLIKVDPYNTESMNIRSVLYFDKELVYNASLHASVPKSVIHVGHEAIDKYIENDANGRYIQSIKTFLPDSSFESTEINGTNYKLEELISIILRFMKDAGDEFIKKRYGESLGIKSVVLGRPVQFSNDTVKDRNAENRLVAAAKIAGFEEIHLQFEPIAAALAYEATLDDTKERKILVGDFGGGTSDFTVMRLRGGTIRKSSDRRDDILSIGGIYIGGDVFDSLLMWDKVGKYFGRDVKFRSAMGTHLLEMPPFIYKIKHWHHIPHLRATDIQASLFKIRSRCDKPEVIDNLMTLIKDNYGFMLFRAIENAKCELSVNEISHITFREFDIKEIVSRMNFEKIIDEEIGKISTCVNNVLSEAGISEDEIDIVYLTGGSSYIPIIRKLFAQRFGPKKVRQKEAFTSVAYGLGLAGSIFM